MVAPGRPPVPVAQAQAPPAHLLTHAAGDEGSSLLHFCLADGTDAEGHLHTQHTHLAHECRATQTYLQRGSALCTHQRYLQLLAASLLLINVKP